MKKILCAMLCLGMLMGCGSPDSKKQNNANITDIETEDKEFYKTKLKDTKLNITDHIKELDEIEKILIDSGYTYATDNGNLALLNPIIDNCRVVTYAQDESSSMILMQIQDGKNFSFIKKADSDTTVVMGDNGNVKWSFELNAPLADTEPDLEDLYEMLEIKEGYNEWSEKYNLSYIEVKYLLDIYYDVLIKKNNVNIIDIKMKQFSKEHYKK